MKSKAYWKAQYEAQLTITEHHRTMEAAMHERIGELEDSLRARSLAELRAVRPIAMPQYPDDPEERDDWGTDPTGLFRDKLPPLSPEEQRIADGLR